jgi:hypothetical protein
VCDGGRSFEIKATLYRKGFPPEEEKAIVRILFRKPSTDIVKVHTPGRMTGYPETEVYRVETM